MRQFWILCIFISFGLTQEVDSLSDSLHQNSKLSVIVKIPTKPVPDEWFSQDKFLHFYFSATIPGLTYYVYTYRLKRDENLGKIYSVSFTAIVGLGKEIYDKKKKGRFSWKDLCWDGLGLTVGYFAFIHDY